MNSNALYTDLSGYYDLMCADINYEGQSAMVCRLHQLFGGEAYRRSGSRHLDLACGSAPHIEHFIHFGYDSSGLDINQPMLDLAHARCPSASFAVGDMCDFTAEQPYDLITCFLYSIHYSGSTEQLLRCFAKVHDALAEGGVFCFNVVDKEKISNALSQRHFAESAGSQFSFQSGWFYGSSGDRQTLQLRIDKTTAGVTESWRDEHAMVAFNFAELQAYLEPLFDVHLFEHDEQKIIPWDQSSGNAVVVCVKRAGEVLSNCSEAA